MSVFSFVSHVNILEYLSRNLLIFKQTLVSGLLCSYPTLLGGAALSAEDKENPKHKWKNPRRKRYYLKIPIISAGIHQYTVTICLFYEQQWTRNSFVQTFA